MALDQYYTLGKPGLRVSRLALGSMTFGTEWGWGADEPTARG
jgi:aryl-alcohol dehydrogenase-like predicted oxidoreductase